MPEISSRLPLLGVVGAIAIAILGGIYFGRGPAVTPPPPVTDADTPDQRVVAHVSGAVGSPGLVSLTEPTRVADAVEAAGGATADADLTAINLAGPVRDGDHIVVPAIGERIGVDDGLIDLNRSTAAKIAELHGIGPVLAERIVAHREERGPFESIEDLLDVPGIGEAKLALLRSGVSSP